MRPLYLYLIITASLLCGCRSQRIDTARQVDYSADLRGMQQRLDSLLASILIERREITDRLSNLKVEHKTVYYSRPDSAGRQYPVVVSETKADKRDKEQTEVDTELAATVQELRNEVSGLRERVDSMLREQEKVAKLSWWDRNKWRIALVVVIMGVVWYMVKQKK